MTDDSIHVDPAAAHPLEEGGSPARFPKVEVVRGHVVQYAQRQWAILIAGALLLIVVAVPRPPSASVRSPQAPSIGVARVSPAPPASIDPIDEMEQLLFAVTNKQRTRVGLPPLGRDDALSAAARSHSEDMLRRRFFGHVNPDRQTPADRVARFSGRSAGTIGENIWMWSGPTLPPRRALVEQAVAGWIDSPAHRNNILGPGFKRLGVGAAVNVSGVRLTAVFGM